MRHYHRVDIELQGCNSNAIITAEGQSAAYYNYLTAGMPQGGVSDVHYYEKVIYKNIYPGIDLEFFTDPVTSPLPPSLTHDANAKGGIGSGVEYNFIVHPGGNPADIKLAYKGANKVTLTDNKLIVNVAAGDLTENIPTSYLKNNPSANIKVSYADLGNNVFTFSLPSDLGVLNADLVIDPTPNLKWGTYYGGSGNDFSYDIALDASNNVYVTGTTTSTIGIATTGAYQTTLSGGEDVFISKFNSTGTSLIWGTYYGGTGNDEGYTIALDASNNIYITGNTNSTTGIATPGAYKTTSGAIFVAKFNSTGTSLLWGTYYGGSGVGGGEGIALDASNNVYITGITNNTTGIATAGSYQTTYGGGIQDAFVAKFNSTGSSLLWGTYYGGAGQDQGLGIALDVTDNIYITGQTASTTGIATIGAYLTIYVGSSGSNNAFVAKFNSTGSSLLWGTYYGGAGGDVGYGITLDASDNVYITGYTESITGIATTGAYQTTNGGDNAFVAKFNATGTSLLWGTYYGGPGYSSGSGITIDASDNVYITGFTNDSISGIATTGAYQATYGGGINDAFVAKFNFTCSSLLWGTYYGGTGNDVGNGIALDVSGNVYIIGKTNSISDIATTGAYQTTYGGGWDVFVAMFDSTGSASVPPITGPSSVCIGSTITLSDATSGGTWSSSNTAIATVGLSSGVVSGVSVGTVTISYSVSAGIATATVIVDPPPSAIAGTMQVCAGSTTVLSDATTGGNWSSGSPGIATIDSATGIVTGVTAGAAIITYTGNCGFVTATVTVTPSSGAGIIIAPTGLCVGSTTSLSDTVSGGVWGISNGNATLSGDMVTGVSPGMDTISYAVTSASCGTATVTAVITVATAPNAGSISGDTTVCAGHMITLSDSTTGGMWSSHNNGLATVSAAGVVSAALSAGRDTISYVVTNACSTDSATYAITVDPLPPISPITGPDSACPDVTFMLSDTTSPGVWGANNPSVLSIDSSGLVSTFAAGSAIITYTTGPNAQSCYSTATYTVTITFQGTFTVDSTISPVSCYGGNNGSIKLTTSGTQNYSYLWYNVVSSDSFLTGQPSGYDTVSIKAEVTQCLEVLTFYIPQPGPLQLTAAAKSDTCDEGKGSISIAVTGGTGGYLYLWSDKKTGQEITGLLAGAYSVTVTDSAGCTKSIAATVGEDTTCNSIVIYNVITPNGDGINDTWVIEGLAAYPNNTVQLFDKWGDLVYEKTNYQNDFGGKGKSGDLPDGTYYYLVKLNAANLKGGGNVWTGYLMVKR